MYMYDSKCSCLKETWYDTIQSMCEGNMIWYNTIHVKIAYVERGKERKKAYRCVCLYVCVRVCMSVCVFDKRDLIRGSMNHHGWTTDLCVCVWVSEWVHVVVWKACIVKIQHIWPCACVHAHAFARFPSFSSSLVVPVCNTEMARYSSAADTLGLSTLSIE